VVKNAAALARAPRVVAKDPVIVNVGQIQRLIVTAQGTVHEGYVALAAAVGLRPGELLGLQWPDLDLEAGTLRVERTLARRAHVGLVVGPPKSKRSRRTVRIPAFAVAALRAHQGRQRVREAAAGDAWSHSGFVFTSDFGTALDPANIRRAFNGLLVEAALPHMRLHDLRHAAATLMLSGGVDVRTVMEVMGTRRSVSR
jgi:integrase